MTTKRTTPKATARGHKQIQTMIPEEITTEQVDELVNKCSSLNDDYLTSKELHRCDKFIDTLYKKRADCRRGEFNGFNQYLSSLRKKIASRSNIPNWYALNKL